MSSGPAIAAHLILGAREEPFLEAMLESVSGAATLLIVNDNAPDPSPHAAHTGIEFLCPQRLAGRGSHAFQRL